MNSAISAIIANAVIDYSCIINNCLVYINIMHDGSVDAGDSHIISEDAAFPNSADITCSRVSPSIIYTAIKTNIRSPIAAMPYVDSVIESPIRRGPEPTDLGWHNPDTRNPVIPQLRVIGPVARSPQPAVDRAWRLIIDRQRRRRNISTNRNTHFDLSR
jgi:hypothetical protein